MSDPTLMTLIGNDSPVTMSPCESSSVPGRVGVADPDPDLLPLSPWGPGDSRPGAPSVTGVLVPAFPVPKNTVLGSFVPKAVQIFSTKPLQSAWSTQMRSPIRDVSH